MAPKAAALEVMWLTHLAAPVSGSALEGLFLAEVVVDFSSQGDAAAVQRGLHKKEKEGKFLCVNSK